MNHHVTITLHDVEGSKGGVWPKSMTSTVSVDDVMKQVEFESFNPNREFEWRFNGIPLRGASELTWPLGRVESGHGGFYEVAVKKPRNR